MLVLLTPAQPGRIPYSGLTSDPMKRDTSQSFEMTTGAEKAEQADPTRILIIGYGNTLRSDDGAGQIVADIIEQWQIPTVQSLALHQLTPELAEPLSTAQLAIFVDVYIANPETEATPTLHCIDLNIDQALEPSTNQIAPMGHTVDPRSLLALTQQVYNAVPPSWWILIPAINFEVGEQLSPMTQQGITAALAWIKPLIQGE